MMTVLLAATAALSCPVPNGWTLDKAERDVAPGVTEVTVRLTSPTNAVPPRFTLDFDRSGARADHVWSPYDERYALWPKEWGARPLASELAFRAPVAAAFAEDGSNTLAVACSEAFRKVEYGLTIGASDCRLYGSFAFFSKPEPMRRDYAVTVRLDARRVPGSEAVRAAADWVAEAARLEAAYVPEAAYDPVYSTWYAYWQDVRADELERDIAIGAALGMRTAILDDGWQKEKSVSTYSATGDWLPVAKRFPDMRAHVAKVHSLGMRYLLWMSVPFVGIESQAWSRFKDKFLNRPGTGAGAVGILDPRFPEVRAYLIATYERAVRDWGFDGLKLDFIDNFKTPEKDPAEEDGYAGRDIRFLPEAVDVLMKDVLARLKAIRPDVLIEFRQHYMGPAIRQYGNMIRALDCPGESSKIRKLVADLRLTSGKTSVHSDMLVWSPDETPERAAKPILNALFATVQYSMVLNRLPESHKAVIRHWLAFSQAHRETLLKSEFRPHRPENQYPLLEAESAGERILAVYAVGTVAPAEGAKRTYVINAAEGGRVVVSCDRARRADVYDTFGRLVAQGVPVPAGCTALAVPPSGYACLTCE